MAIYRLSGVAPRSAYLSSRFARRLELRAYAAELEAAGWTSTARWLGSPGEIDSLGRSVVEGVLVESEPAFAARFAAEDLADVARASVFVAFGELPGSTVPGAGRGGRHVEFGYALALSLRVILVGDPETVFHYLDRVERVASWPDALARLLK